MKGAYHPFTKALYEQVGDGSVRVTLDGKEGIFGANGQWIEGAIRECDPQMCGWIAGPKVHNHRMADT